MTQNIFISKRKESEIITNPIIPCYYKASDYGLSTKYSGKNVKIAIIDSGCPSHKDIMDPEGFISFINKHQDIKDIHGHSTMISGILTAQNKNCVNGLATGSLYYHAKVIDDQGHCDFAPLVAAILWSIIKEVDIILLAMGTKTDYSVLHDAIKKAYESNICIIAASGNIKDEEEADFPARYLEVLSVGNKKDGGKNKKLFSYGNHISSFFLTLLMRQFQYT